MGGDIGADARLPVPVAAYGYLHVLAAQAHELSQTGRCHEALAVADRAEPLARAAGDETTVSFLVQARMYAYLLLGRHDEAARAGEELLRRHRRAHYSLGAAKTLFDLAELYVLRGRFAEGMRYIAQGTLLLDRCPPRGDRYISALQSLTDAANAAELYETAASAYERLRAVPARQHRPNMITNHEMSYAAMLLFWGLRLDHLGRHPEAAVRLRRSAEISERWIAAFAEEPDAPERIEVVSAGLALALAKLGEHDQAARLAERIVVPLRRMEQHWGARQAHLALGVSLRAAGDLAGARREFVAAEQLCRYGVRPDERLIIRYELAALAADVTGDQAGRDLLETVREQTRYLWEVRLQRLFMLRQAQQREVLEAQRHEAETEMLRDPLTGLGNRRRFEQLIGGVDAGRLAGPVVLLLIDLDEFKAINDRCSHSAGDQVLREVAEILRASCRPGDVPVRYAGDEFAVFLQADLAVGVAIAERIRAAVRERDFSTITGATPVSISTGAALLHPGMTGQELFSAADMALYRAKRHGRDRVAA